MVAGFLFWFFLIGLIVATLQDLKRREVDDWLNILLLVGGGVFIFYSSILKGNLNWIFEFGFSDSILQMWAAYLYEFHHRKPFKKFAACVTPDETAQSHKLFTAALKSHREQITLPVIPVI